jgi:outer membrane protein TolC
MLDFITGIDFMKRIKYWVAMMIIINTGAFAQELTLKQCFDYARSNNNGIKVSRLDSIVSDKKVKEQIGAGLPQIDATGSLTDNVLVATQMMPAEMVGGQSGSYFGIKMGMQYDVSAKLSLSQKLFDQSFWVGLDAAKLNTQVSNLNIVKQEEQTAFDVSKAYYRVAVVQKQLHNLKYILEILEKTLKMTEIKYQNGVAKKIDVDRLKVSYNSTKSRLVQTELMYKQYLNNLKYTMGMPLEMQMQVVDINSYDIDTADYSNIEQDTAVIHNRVDYLIQKAMITAQELNRDNNKASYLPTLSLTASIGVQSMSNQFNFWESNTSWYSNSAIGLTMKIPIFSGFSTQAKVEQSEVNIEIEKENLDEKEKSIKVDISNYYMQLKSAAESLQSEKDNLELAKTVYENTQIEYSLGKSASIDLIQAESSWLDAQNSYYSKLLDLFLAQIDLEKNKGTLLNFINNLK